MQPGISPSISSGSSSSPASFAIRNHEHSPSLGMSPIPQTGDSSSPVVSRRDPEFDFCPRDGDIETERHSVKPPERSMDSPLPNREISPTALMYYSCKNGARGACHVDSILDPAGYRNAIWQPAQSSSARHLDNESGLQCTIRMRLPINL